MQEDDFVLSGDEAGLSENAKANSKEIFQGALRESVELSGKEKRKLLDQQHPELIPLISHFSESIKALKNRTCIATKVLLENDSSAQVRSRQRVCCIHDRLKYSSE